MTSTAYGMRALAGELDKLARAVEGERNNTLNDVWIKLCQRINAGHLDKAEAAQQVCRIARQIGLGDGEIRATMASAENGARSRPRDVPAPARPTDLAGDPVWAGMLPAGPAAAAPAAAGPPPPSLPDEFWAERGHLARIRQAAHSRGRSAEAVLGAALARAAADTPHLHKLPPVVGSRCGLSLIVALAGPSGTGKSSSKSIAAELLPARLLKPDCDDVPPGSGEGLIELLFEWVADDDGKRAKRLTRHNVLAFADEGEVLAIQARRNTSSTILPVIRSIFTDGTLGQANASEDRRRRVPGGQYAYGIVLGIQPAKAGPLFDDSGGGTPQRFLWAPTDAPTPPPGARPEWPGPLERPRLDYRGASSADGMRYFELDPAIVAEVQAGDHRRQTEGCDPLDEHADLIRLKVAAVLAVLDGRQRVGRDDWRLAGMVRDLSDATRDRALATVRRDDAERNRRRGESEGERQIAAGDRVTDQAMRRVARWIVGKLGDGEPTAASKLRERLASRDRDHFGAAIDQLQAAGMIEVEGEVGVDARLRARI